MKILVVAPFYKPYNNPRARRWVAVCDALRALGHEVWVVTSKGPADWRSEGEVCVVRTGYNSLKEWLGRFVTVRRGQVGQGVPGRMGIVMQWLSDHVLEKVWWPDNAFLWVWPARRRIKKLLKSSSFDGVISVGLPFSAHVAVLGLPQRFELPWLVDMGDPFTPIEETRHNNRRLYGAINRRTEAAVLQACTAFVLTNTAAVELYRRAFGDYAHKLVCIGPVAHPFDFPILASGTRTKLGYFGTFYRDVRSPAPLLNWFHAISTETDVELHIAGEVFATYATLFTQYQKLLGDRLVFHGHLTHREAQQLMADCQILLSLGNTTTHQLPSKCADYYVSGLPVIHLSVAQTDPVDVYFQDHPHYLSIKVGDNDAIETSRQFIIERAGRYLNKAHVERFLKLNSAQAVALQYLAALFKA